MNVKSMKIAALRAPGFVTWVAGVVAMAALGLQ